MTMASQKASVPRAGRSSPRIRFTVDEFIRMSQADIFDERVELIAGRIYKMHAQANEHMWAISKVARAFLMRFPADKFYVVVQGTLYLTRYSAPDPDLHVFNVPEGTPAVQLPKASLVVEVSHTTYRRDTGLKLRTYAAAGIADYWVINTRERRVEIRRNPEHVGEGMMGWRYTSTEFFEIGKTVSPLAFPHIVIPVADLVP